MNSLKRIVFSLCLAYLVLLAAMYVLQRNFVFAPSTDKVSPAAAGLSGVRAIELPSPAGPLTNWYLPAASGMPTLLYFHGNGGAIHHRAYKIEQYAAMGYGMFVVGYPGYGGNPGEPSEAGFIDAALTAYEYLADLPGVDRIVLYGESLGSAVATQVAAQRQAVALVLAAPMFSVAAVGGDRFPFLPVAWLIKDAFNSHEHIASIDAPLLVVHGARDRIVPITSGQALFELAREPKQWVTFENASHNDLYSHGMADVVHLFLSKEPLEDYP